MCGAAPKPPKIRGALCGRLFDATGAVVPDAGLRVLGDADRIIADVQADSKGISSFRISRKVAIV
jgi:hypothetical protein